MIFSHAYIGILLQILEYNSYYFIPFCPQINNVPAAYIRADSLLLLHDFLNEKLK